MATPKTTSIKMNLYFTNESRDTLKSFTSFITVKVITKLNLVNRKLGHFTVVCLVTWP